MIFLRKATLPASGAVLYPSDEESESYLSRMKDGQTVAVEAKRARSPQHHRKFFAVLNDVFDNQEQFKSVDDLLDAVKLELGHSKLKERFGGERWREPKSISFHNMGQDEFNKFYDRAMDALCLHFNLDRELLEQESPPEDPHLSGAAESPSPGDSTSEEPLPDVPNKQPTDGGSELTLETILAAIGHADTVEDIEAVTVGVPDLVAEEQEIAHKAAETRKGELCMAAG